MPNVVSTLRPNHSPKIVWRSVEAGHPAAVLLLKLVTLVGVDQVVGEIGEQIEIVIEPVGHDLRFGICASMMPFALQAITMAMAAVGRIECAEEALIVTEIAGRRGSDQSRIGELIARVPAGSSVTAGRDAETLVVAALAVGHESVEFVVVVRMHPWAAIVIGFSAVQQIARAELARDAENEPRKLVHAAVDLDEVLGQRLQNTTWAFPAEP